MSDHQPKEDFFKPIGELAQEADDLQSDDEDQTTTNAKAPVVDEERPIYEVESLCMRCGENGVTRMMLTTIPYFQEVILTSFRCEHCGEQNNEVQSAGKVRDQGTVYTAKILIRKDTNRQLVRSSNCTITVPEFELTIPPQKGQLTTVEGLLRDVIADLAIGQPLRRIQDEATYNKIDTLLKKIHTALGDDEEGEPVTVTADGDPIPGDTPITPFTIKLDDPSGNSWIEFIGSMADPKWSMKTYDRTKEQTEALGLTADESTPSGSSTKPSKVPTKIAKPTNEALEAIRKAHEGDEEEYIGLPNEEIFVFPGVCSSCGAPLDTMMKKVSIPYFKEILIMSTNCDKCGYRDNEIKSGSAISEQGKRITLKVEDEEDLARDILKSESCGLEIPEIGLTLQPGTLGGRFTTLEGLLSQVYDELSQKAFARGDTVEDKEDGKSFETFLGKLKKVMTAATPFTVILDDPLANSYLQNIYAPDPDPNMTTEVYDRTWAQNEDLGLNDMIVEGYEGDPNAEAEKEEHHTVDKATA